MQNLVFQALGGLIVAVYNEHPPTDEDHRKALAVFRTMDFDRAKFLGVTRGGAPTPAQRKELTDTLRGRELQAAIVSDVRLVRGVVTALSWFNRKIRAYSMGEMEQALEYLEVPEGKRDRVRATVRHLEIDVNVTPYEHEPRTAARG